MSLPNVPDAVIFDMDGLLFDTERLYEEASLAATAELGCAMDRTFFRTTVGSNWIVIRASLLDHYGPAFAADDLRTRARRIFGELIETELVLKPGVLELLDLLDELDIPRAIATTSSHQTARHHLLAHRLEKRFHSVVAAGDKPAPETPS